MLDLVIVLISDDISQSFLPAAALLSREVGSTYLLYNGLKIVLGDCLDNFLDEDIFVESKVLCFDLVEKLFASRFGDQKCLCGSPCLESNSRGPASFSNE